MRRRVPTVLLVAAAACVAALGFLAGRPGSSDPAVVAVRVWPPTGPAERATGVVVARDRVLTVAHVLEAGRRIEVLGADGVRRRAAVVRRRPGDDLAVLRVPGAVGPPVRVDDPNGRLRLLLARDGGARAVPVTVRRRLVARLVDQPGRPRRPSLELAAGVVAGDSGAPVVDGDGDVVAVVYARSRRRDTAAYAVHGPGLRELAG